MHNRDDIKMKNGIYTHYGASWIDKQIDLKLRIIVNTVLKNVPRVKSIFLAGGFGKGEGSVEVRPDGDVKCLRDFDIVVIVDRIPDETTQQRLHSSIYKSLGLLDPEGNLFRFSKFVVGVYFRRKDDLIYPDIWFYDLKSASRLLYGEDVRNLIPWGKKDVPLSSGLRILLEKVCGLLGAFSYRGTNELSEEQRKTLIFECYKTFIEICTALCILAGKYEPRYATRANIFEDFFFDEFPDFVQAIPDLPKKVRQYTAFKLKPDFTKICEDPIELWFSARDSLGKALCLYLRRYLILNTSEWADLPKQMKIVARQYYKPFLKPFMNKKMRGSNKIMLDIASFLYNALTNLEYAIIVTRNIGRLYLRPLSRFHISPSLKFFPSGIMILFSLNRDGTLNRELLKKAMYELRHCIPVNISTLDRSGWDALRRYFLKAYNLYSGYHLVK